MCIQAFASKASDPLSNFYALLEAKGHKKKGVDATSLSPAQFDKLLGSDPELASAFAAVDRAQQQHLASLRTRPRAAAKPPVRVAVTGAAGGIGCVCSLLFNSCFCFVYCCVEASDACALCSSIHVCVCVLLC